MQEKTALEVACKYIFILLLFCLPLSIEKSFFGTDTNLLWFTEPLCALLTILLGVYIIKNRKSKLYLTPLDYLSAVFLASIFFSVIVSNNYFVSIKFAISLVWYFVGGYLVVRMFNFSPFQRKLSVLSFIAGSFILCLYVLKNFSVLGIFYETSYEVSKPFIPEGHTDLSVVIEPAFLISAVLLLLLPWNKSKTIAYLGAITTSFLALIMFSCSKASYAAIFLCICFFISILGIRYRKEISKSLFKYGLRMALALVPFVLLLSIWKFSDIRHYYKVRNDPKSFIVSGSTHYDSKDSRTYKQTNMFDEVFNQSTDVEKNKSNQERLNRWSAGIDMFSFHPTFGIGVGTYPDKYLDYQKEKSVKIEQNYLTENRMNLHNIFLGWLVEGGIVTFLCGSFMIAVFFAWLYQEYKKGKSSYIKLLLATYMVSFVFHGMFHDFGQNARVIIPFWIAMAIVSKQMAFRKKLSKEEGIII